MPVPVAIASAAENYRFNSDFLTKMVSDIPHEQWHRHPDGQCNHIAWIMGHVIWTRKQLLRRLGTEWSQPWLDLFARGAKCEDGAGYPSPDTLIDAWRDCSGILAGALDSASDEALAQPAKNGPPSLDGKESGIVNFLAIHETYHLGQASYLRGWLGHKGLMG
jgi:uncharacterized damage-inducible protein DinB